MWTNGGVSAPRSLSYVTTLACFAFVLLALIYYTVDVQKWWSGAPFLFPGEVQLLPTVMKWTHLEATTGLYCWNFEATELNLESSDYGVFPNS